MNYMMRTIASLCWHQALACHLVFQIALIPACADPHHLVPCKVPLLQYGKASWAACLEGEPFCFQGHPRFQETALQKGCLAESDLYLHLSTARIIYHFSLLTDQCSWHCSHSHDQDYFLMPILLIESRHTQTTHSEHPHSKRPCTLLPKLASPCCFSATIIALHTASSIKALQEKNHRSKDCHCTLTAQQKNSSYGPSAFLPCWDSLHNSPSLFPGHGWGWATSWGMSSTQRSKPLKAPCAVSSDQETELLKSEQANLLIETNQAKVHCYI